ncbi:MAG TPA: glycogen debranching protein GlgX [Methylovirgula sp.]
MGHAQSRLQPGVPYPLGATWDGLGTNFAVFSAHAERIDLCVFDPSGRREIDRIPLPESTDEVWHGYLPNAHAGLVYGYRAHGPYDPQNGHRFNSHKLLLDPYARQLSGELRWSDALFGYRINSPRGDLSFDRRDSAAGMLKAVVVDETFNWGDDRPPAIPWAETVIYEAHVRGLTFLRDDLRFPDRGTFSALTDPKVVDHLKRLGITAIELMPVHAFLQDRHLLEKKLRNYWGYNTIGFFVVEPRYLSTGSANEMRVAIRRLHAAGIEVFLDVVYNHTAEGSEFGPTLSFRGLDNASYYRLMPGNLRHCVSDTGTGNTLNLSHPRVLQMVMDSLRYWVTSFHVDGFRFDLGVTLGREPNGFDAGAGFFDALRQDPVLAHVKLISEPWDIGPNGYQLGQHPTGFAEWNDRFRNGVRRFWRGDTGARQDFAVRLSGSSDIFDRRARRPWASINYIASHDGFTLADVVSYAERHNEANGEANMDGPHETISCNWGMEGPTEYPDILATRARLRRSMLTTLFLAHGTPMLLAGDEFGRTQRGNNNAYCQDNDVSWIHWKQMDSPEGREMTTFVARLVALRREYPVLRCRNFLHGREEPTTGIADIGWFDQHGKPISVDAWNDPKERVIVLRRAERTDEDHVAALTLLLNPTAERLDFQLPAPHAPSRVLIDSSDPNGNEQDLDGDHLTLPPQTAVLLLGIHEGAQ